MKVLREITNILFGLFEIASAFAFGIFLITSIFKDKFINLGCAGISLVLTAICYIVYHFTYEKTAHRKVVFTNKVTCSNCEQSKARGSVEIIEIYFDDKSLDVRCPFDKNDCPRISR